MSYADLAAELAGQIPGLSPVLASTFIKRAWRDIRNERNWSFKTVQSSLTLPAMITAGTVSRTQYSPTLTFSAAATTALTPFVVGPPTLNQLQIRFPGGPLYRITAVTQTVPVIIVTLDRPVTEATSATAAYQVYRAYISPPVPDFTRWESFDDPSGAMVTLSNTRITKLSTEFDRRDPTRSSAGTPTYLGFLASDPLSVPPNAPIYEFWPHPTAALSLVVTYKRRGPEFTLAADVQPELFSDELIVGRALAWYALPWAQANKARFPQLAKTDFLTLIQNAKLQYVYDLNVHRLLDEEQALQTVYNPGHFGGGRSASGEAPIGDARYWQSHPITW